MASLTDLSDVLNRGTGGGGDTWQRVFWHRDPRIKRYGTTSGTIPSPVAGQWSSAWCHIGSPNGSGSLPGAVSAPTSSTSGAISFRNPIAGRQNWLVCCKITSSHDMVAVLYDRLLHISGLDGTNTGAQTVGGTLTRYTDGVGNIMWAEIYGPLGSTGTTISASYTNQAGASGQTTIAATIGSTGFNEQFRIINLPLAAGDFGIQAVASATLAASTLTAGNFGITVAHPISAISLPANAAPRDLLSTLPGPTEVKSDACLAIAYLSHSTSLPYLFGSLHFLEK